MTKYRPLRPARAASLSALLPLIVLASISAVGAADTPSVKLALSFRPVQKGVVHENPKQADYRKCRVEVERKGKTSGWIVFGPGGQVLRRFVDTNADNVVDQWRYYHRGLEVYRDIDTDFNNKVDQCRWLNTGGTKWGIDRNEDGEIDEWKVISAAETSFEAIAAMSANDAKRLRDAVEAVADGRPPHRRQSRALMGPMLKVIGYIDPALETAGPSARRDMWRAAPPMAIMSKLSQVFSFLAPDRRGLAAIAVMTIAAAAVAVALVALL
ncbi:MAG: hypothetical protein IID45_13395 [Planctomycetes bacterium]|nr:hypothetical protein [Planctomycetota bacterium]